MENVLYSLKYTLLKCSRYNNRAQTRNAVKLAHKIFGTKSSDRIPIIVLHGFLGSKKNWNTMSIKLAAANNTIVVAADARNHGESPHHDSHTYPELAADVSLLIDTLNFDTAHIIGHSMGGRTGMALALTEAVKVKTLCVVDISPISQAGLDNNFFPRLLDVMKAINFSGLDAGTARTLAKAKIMASGLIDNPVLLSFVFMNLGMKADNTIGWMCNVDALKNHFRDIAIFPDMSGKIYDGPTLFVGGEQSNYIPEGDLPGIKRLFPKVVLKYVRGVGHNVHAEDPATFLNMATEFIMNNK